jgi:hypothetical protein
MITVGGLWPSHGFDAGVEVGRQFITLGLHPSKNQARIIKKLNNQIL